MTTMNPISHKFSRLWEIFHWLQLLLREAGLLARRHDGAGRTARGSNPQIAAAAPVAVENTKALRGAMRSVQPGLVGRISSGLRRGDTRFDKKGSFREIVLFGDGLEQ